MAEEVDNRIEMEVTVKFRYKTDPSNYELSGPAESIAEEVAIMDADEFDGNPDTLYEMMEAEAGAWTIEVKPVTENEE